MKRLMKVVTRRRTPSNGGESVVQLSVPREELRVLAADLGVPPSKSGTLLKYTNVVKRWKLRHFTLENGVLLYSSASSDDENDDDDPVPNSTTAHEHEHKSRKKSRKKRLLRRTSKDDNEREIKGEINIQHAMISADDSDSCRFAIDVGHDVFHCKADTPALRDEWVNELNRSIDYFRGLIQRAVARAQETNNIEKHTENPQGSVPTPSDQAKQSSNPSTPTSNGPANMTNGVIPSDESEDSVLEDDGLKEAEQSHRALVAELRRIVMFWRERWMETSSSLDDERNLLTTLGETFMDASGPVRKDGQTAPEIAKGLVDLATWCLHVLQTNDDVFDRRLKADLARRMAGGLPVFPPVSPKLVTPHSMPLSTDLPSMDEDSDSEFVDALSRAVSKRSSFAKHPPPPYSEGSSSVASPSPPVPKELAEEKDDLLKGASVKSSNIRRVSTATLMKGYKGPRTRLPPLQGPRERLNIFGILKDAVGKDLSKIALPVGLNEPLSFVQRLAEDIEYCELLDKAVDEPDSNRRLMYVAAMVISHYSSTQGRVGKPFNPLLGETACLIRPDKGKGVRFISEQVSHHPPISASYAEGSGGSWKYYNAIEVKNKFWGKSLEVFPTGLNHIEIPKYGDHYVLEQVTACVHNIVVGRPWLDNYGTMEIVNRTNGGRCKIEFNKTGWMSDAKSFASINGTIYDADGKKTIKIGGNWTECVYEDLGHGKKNKIWEVEERPPDGASQSYNMTKWAITLNAEVSPEERKMLPPTDSRLRPDQRALEQGKLELGSRLKQDLEEGQRRRRREMEERNESWEPLWFEKVTDEVTGQTDYHYRGEFFKKQAIGDWSKCTDIFSCASSQP